MYKYKEVSTWMDGSDCKDCNDYEKENKKLKEKNKQLKKLLLDMKDYIGVPYWEGEIEKALK